MPSKLYDTVNMTYVWETFVVYIDYEYPSHFETFMGGDI